MSATNQAEIREAARRTARMVGMTAAMLGLLYGYDQVNVGVAQIFFAPDLGLSTSNTETANTGVAYGTLLGVLVGGILIDKLGRKTTTIYVCIGYGVFCLAQALAWNFASLFTARVLLGFAIGISIIAVPVFIAESAATAIRGRTLAAYQLFCVVGQILVYIFAIALVYANPSWNWRIMFAVAAVPIIFLLPLVLKMPETPRWLMMKGREEEAHRTLQLVDPDADHDAVIADMKQTISDESAGSLKEFFSKPYLRAAIFMIIMGLLIQITGINAFTTYGPIFAKMMGFGNMGSFVLNGLNVLVSAVAVLLAMRLVDRWGRKPVVMSGFAVMVVGMAIMVLAYATAPQIKIIDGAPVGDLDGWQGWQQACALGGMIIATAAFNFGVGATVWSFASESLPTRLRSYGAVTLLAADLVGNIIVVQRTVTLLNSAGGVVTFGLFGVLSMIAILFVWKFAPETKGRDVDDVHKFWENGGKWPEELQSGPKSA